jgi:hypothetical protein
MAIILIEFWAQATEFQASALVNKRPAIQHSDRGSVSQVLDTAFADMRSGRRT